MDQRIESLLDELRTARDVEAAALLSANDTAYHIERLRVIWSGQNAQLKECIAEVERIQKELAHAVNDVTAPYLLAEAEQ